MGIGQPVFPTHVGVFPGISLGRTGRGRLPHARGGVSHNHSSTTFLAGSSPRTWGCFSTYSLGNSLCIVFPTHVGVFLLDKDILVEVKSLPHARGGVSNGLKKKGRAGRSSPRTWGCFQVRARQAQAFGVFPTHVGVFPNPQAYVFRRLRSSPRTWGCF